MIAEPPGLGQLDLIVHLESPLRIDGEGVDVRRDALGRPCIPAATIKGRARVEAGQLCESLAWLTCDRRGVHCRPADSAICPLCLLFGGKGIAGGVFFTDLIADSVPVLTMLIRGRAEVVLAVPAGTRCLGTIRYQLPASARRPYALLIASLLAIDRLGSQTGVGWGRCRVQIPKPAIDLAAVRSTLWQTLSDS